MNSDCVARQVIVQRMLVPSVTCWRGRVFTITSPYEAVHQFTRIPQTPRSNPYYYLVLASTGMAYPYFVGFTANVDSDPRIISGLSGLWLKKEKDRE